MKFLKQEMSFSKRKKLETSMICINKAFPFIKRISKLIRNIEWNLLRVCNIKQSILQETARRNFPCQTYNYKCKLMEDIGTCSSRRKTPMILNIYICIRRRKHQERPMILCPVNLKIKK